MARGVLGRARPQGAGGRLGNPALRAVAHGAELRDRSISCPIGGQRQLQGRFVTMSILQDDGRNIIFIVGKEKNELLTALADCPIGHGTAPALFPDYLAMYGRRH